MAMIDYEANFRTFMLGFAPVSSTFGARVYAATDTPPESYDPADGPAICSRVRPSLVPYVKGIHSLSFQLKIYAQDTLSAMTAWRTLVDEIDEQSGSGIQFVRLEQNGQSLVESDTGRHFILGFFTAHMWDL